MIAAVVVLVLLVIAATFAMQWTRRRRAALTAGRLGGTVVGPTESLPAGAAAAPPAAQPSGSVGAPNPAVPPPATPPDQRTGIATSGPPVLLRVCGLPAVAWQRREQREHQWEPMRLALVVDAGVGLPVLTMNHRSLFSGSSAATGIAPLDQEFQTVGELAAWGPVLARPDVQQALLAFPLESLDVMGMRITVVSRDGVHLEPDATQGIAQVAATLIGAVPAQITSASPTAPPTALTGDLTDPDSVVQGVLARSGLSPDQQQAMMQLIRARQQG